MHFISFISLTVVSVMALPVTNEGGSSKELSKEQIQAIFDTWTKTGGYGSPVPITDQLYAAYKERVVPAMDLAEQAQFLATLAYQSNGLQKKPSEECKTGSCPEGKFFGRGLMNLSWEENYKAASEAIFKDAKKLVENPELASEDKNSWQIALWFWNTNIRMQEKFFPSLNKKEFGMVVDALNGANECAGGPSKEAKQRLEIYNAVLEITKIGGKGTLELCNHPAQTTKTAEAGAPTATSAVPNATSAVPTASPAALTASPAAPTATPATK